MKAVIFPLFLVLSICSSIQADSIVGRWSSGLVVEEFVRHEAQASDDESFVEPEKFGKVIEAFLTPSLDGWKYSTERNAIASGAILIPDDGEYWFRTDSFYDRNMLLINGEIVCNYMDGGSRVKKITLKKGMVPIKSIGFVNGRGGTQGIKVDWKTPSMKELGPIPSDHLFHKPREKELSWTPAKGDPRRVFVLPKPPADPAVPTKRKMVAEELVIVAKDFVTEIYHNGRRLQRHERRMVLDRFGATVEKVDLVVKPGDWLVFHVANNRLRHGGSKYFGLAGLVDDEVSLVSQAESENWSSCDTPASVHEFIHFREAGTESRVVEIGKPWSEGRKFMKKYSGHEFEGDAIWGTTSSTWIKYIAPQ